MATRGNAGTVAEGNVVIGADLTGAQQGLQKLPGQVGAAVTKAQGEVSRRGGLLGSIVHGAGHGTRGLTHLIHGLTGLFGIGAAFHAGREIRDHITGESEMERLQKVVSDSRTLKATEQLDRLKPEIEEKQLELGAIEEDSGRLRARGRELESKAAEAESLRDSGEARRLRAEAMRMYRGAAEADAAHGLLRHQLKEQLEFLETQRGQSEQQLSGERIVAERKDQTALLGRIAKTLEDIRKQQDEQTAKFYEAQQLTADRFAEGFRELARTAAR